MDRLVTGDAEMKEIDMLEELSYQVSEMESLQQLPLGGIDQLP